MDLFSALLLSLIPLPAFIFGMLFCVDILRRNSETRGAVAVAGKILAAVCLSFFALCLVGYETMCVSILVEVIARW
jgi:hypothetical protein